MTIAKKTILWGFGSLLLLLVAGLLALPLFIDSSALKQKIQATISEQNLGEIDYREARLSFFPLPHLTIRQMAFSAPNGLKAGILSLQIYPALLPLFRGQLRFSKIVLDTPEIHAILPTKQGEPKNSLKEAAPIDLADILRKAIAPLTAYSSRLKVSIDRGYLTIDDGGQPKLRMTDLALDAGITVKTPRSFETRLDVSGAMLTVHRKDQAVAIDCDGMNAALQVEGDLVSVELTDLDLTAPVLRLSGRFVASPNISGFSFDLNGKELDVKAVRAAALGLGGDVETVRDIFSYMKGGRIPKIQVSSKGETLSALGDMDNLIIRGRMENGEISIDDIGMQLIEVDGDVLISKGILEASGVSARSGETTGRDGTLKIGLGEDNDAFHLDILLDSELHQLPDMLEKIIDHEAFIRELQMIDNLKGKGKARLILGEDLNDLNTTLEVSDINFSADYQRVPFPITVSRGRLSFTENRVRIEDFDGSVGKSIFSATFCNVEWENGLRLDIPAGRLNLDLGELYPWVSSIDDLREGLADVKKVHGNLDLSTFTLINPHDPIDKSKRWQLSATGAVQKVTIHAKQLPERLLLSSGKIQLAPNQLSFQALNAQLLDADLDLTGTLQGDISHLDRVNVSLNGRVGEKSIRFLNQDGHLPDAYAVRTPIQFANADIIWQSPDQFEIKGNLLFPKNVKIVTDFHYQQGFLTVNRLDIQDQDSEVSCAFGLGTNKINMTFNGFLNHQTLGRMFLGERWSDGWLKGDFKVAFVKGNLSESSLQGRLEGGNFKFPVAEEAPLVIEKFMLSAENKRIAVNDLALAYLENRVALKGQADITADIIMLDLDASAGDLKWDVSEKTSEEPVKNPSDNSEINLWEYPVSGSINLAAESFSLGEYTWQPVRAKLSKDQGKIKVDVIEANLCGIDTVGTLQADGNLLDMDFQYTAKDRNFVTTYSCLSKIQIEMTGMYELSGQFKAQGPLDTLLGSAKGKFEFNSRNGVITRDKRLSRILEVVNFTEIVKGRIPDLRSQGFSYDVINVQGEFENNMIIFNKIFMDGKTLDLLGKGTHDMEQNMLDLEFLAAPFKTVDTAIKRIPGVNYLMAGSLISIPVRIKGNSNDPKVSIMSPSDISSNFLDFAERTIKSPVKLIQYWNPYKKTESEE